MISILLQSISILILIIGFFACIYGVKKKSLKGIIIFDDCCGLSGLILIGLAYYEKTLSHCLIGILLVGWALYDFSIRTCKKKKRSIKRENKDE